MLHCSECWSDVTAISNRNLKVEFCRHSLRLITSFTNCNDPIIITVILLKTYQLLCINDRLNLVIPQIDIKSICNKLDLLASKTLLIFYRNQNVKLMIFFHLPSLQLMSFHCKTAAVEVFVGAHLEAVIRRCSSK